MRLPFRFFLIVLFKVIYVSIFAQTHTSYVDPFIGSEGSGNVFVGPSCHPVSSSIIRGRI